MYFRHVTALLCGVIVSYTASVLNAQEPHLHDNPLRGPEFTDPGKSFEMPRDWLDKNLSYQDWAQDADLAVSLDQFLYPFLKPAIQAYAGQHNLKIAVQEGTCGTSAKALKEKTADITGFCCPPAKTDRFPGIKYHTVGIASIAILANPNVPVDDLTYEQAQDVFQGIIYRWSELNGTAGKAGADKIIQVVGRPHCKQRPGHWRLLLDNEDLFSPRMQEVSTIKDMMMEVANTNGAVGYETMWSIKQYKVHFVKTLSVNGVSPDNSTKIAAGEYPVYRTYNITTWEADNTKRDEAQKLTAYLISEMEKIDPEYGVIPVSRLRENGWKFHEAEVIGQP